MNIAGFGNLVACYTQKHECYCVMFGNESERREFGNSYVAMIMV